MFSVADPLLAVATPADLDEIAALVNAAYRSGEGWTHEAHLVDGPRTSRQDLEAEIAAPDPTAILCLRAVPAGRIEACVLLRRKPARLYLGMLSVRPALMAQGLGRRLLAASEEYARAHGLRRIEMSVIGLRESLLAWYQRRGYRRTGQTVPFPYGNAALGKPQIPGLEFVILEKDV